MDLAKGQPFFDLSAFFIFRFELIYFLRFPCQRFRHVDCWGLFLLSALHAFSICMWGGVKMEKVTVSGSSAT